MGKLRRFLLILAITLLAACDSQEPETPSIPRPTSTSEPAAAPTPAPSITPTLLPTLEPTPHVSIHDQHEQAMLPEFSEDVRLFPEATRYWIDVLVDFDPVRERGTIEGISRIQFTNPHNEALVDIALMLWPNDQQYRSAVEAGPALIDGSLVSPELQLRGLTQRYQLPEPLGPGKTVDISIPFEISTAGPIGRGNMSRFGITQGVLFAPTFYPLVPRLLDGEWEVRTASVGGDTTVSDVAFYEVTITAPADLKLVATGTEIETEELNGSRVRSTFVSGPVRDFAFALGPFLSQEEVVNGVAIRAWVIPDHEEDLEVLLGYAARQFELLSEMIGPYPYIEFDLVDVPGAFGGIEYPGLVTVGTLGGGNVVDVTVHEVGHQWFYGLIGADQLEEPWLDEAFATFSQILYHEEASRRGYATGMLTFFRDQVRDHPDSDLPIGLPVDGYASPGEYGLFVYRKGALFFDALRAELGENKFFEFLQNLFDDYRYEILTAEDFQRSAEGTCECDLDPLFDTWIFAGGETPGL